MSRCVIVGGAKIDDYDYVKSALNDEDFFIYCDGGLSHIEGLGHMPNLVVGDFDSHEPPDFDVETIRLPREKDDTDTFFAAKEGIRRGYSDFLLIGVVGERLDHSLGNISILHYLDSHGIAGRIIDNYSEMEIVSNKPVFISDQYPFFSLLALDGTANGISIENAKFPVKDAEISCDYQYGVSNEVLPGEMAKVVVENGRLLLIKDR